MNRKWFVAISVAGALHVPSGATADPKADSAAVELLGINYSWTRFAEECIGHLSWFATEGSDGGRKTMQALEELGLQSTPETERERVRQKADDYATETMAALKRIVRSDQDFCIETAIVIMRWSHWSTMLVEWVKNPPNPVRP